MKILFSTGCLYTLPIEQVMSMASETGYDGCDLVIDNRFNKDDYIERVEKCLAILPIYSIHAPFMQIKAWGGKTEGLLRTIEVAKRLGANVVNFHPPSWFSLELQFFKSFRKIKNFQDELGCADLFLTIENMPRAGERLMLTSYILNNLQDLIEFGLERNLYFTFDTTHLGTFGDDIVAAFLKIFKTGRLKNIHLSDHGAHKSHLFLGRGSLPIVKLLNTLRRVGYDGMITLELATSEFPKTREWLIKAMRYQRDFIRLHALGV